MTCPACPASCPGTGRRAVQPDRLGPGDRRRAMRPDRQVVHGKRCVRRQAEGVAGVAGAHGVHRRHRPVCYTRGAARSAGGTDRHWPSRGLFRGRAGQGAGLGRPRTCVAWPGPTRKPSLGGSRREEDGGRLRSSRRCRAACMQIIGLRPAWSAPAPGTASSPRCRPLRRLHDHITALACTIPKRDRPFWWWWPIGVGSKSRAAYTAFRSSVMTSAAVESSSSRIFTYRVVVVRSPWPRRCRTRSRSTPWSISHEACVCRTW